MLVAARRIDRDAELAVERQQARIGKGNVDGTRAASLDTAAADCEVRRAVADGDDAGQGDVQAIDVDVDRAIAVVGEGEVTVD